MLGVASFADLETSLAPVPQFFVQAPDGRKDWPEIDRQSKLFNIMRLCAPRVFGMAVPNAGKRNPFKAKREGIRGGAFDTVWHWRDGLTAYLEMKGYSSAGRPGRLEPNQIDFGNRMTQLGIPVACFYDPYDAAAWLRSVGFPVAEFRRVA